MKIRKLVVVVIPIYKNNLSLKELISLQQCLNVLNNHPIVFISPIGLDTTFYEELCENKTKFKIEYFEDFYFKDILGYNNLMLSANFYKTFFNYKFILIYQLDAFVFRDDLIHWCNQNYGFIGAPHLPHQNRPGEFQWLKNYAKFLNAFNSIFNRNHKISNVGNGGFSLRKTRTCYWLVKIFKNRVKKWGNEDGFFKYWGNLLHPFIKLPKDEIALNFSIELMPKESLKKLNHVLPFGCHAFEKYDWETWKPYIINEPIEFSIKNHIS